MRIASSTGVSKFRVFALFLLLVAFAPANLIYAKDSAACVDLLVVSRTKVDLALKTKLQNQCAKNHRPLSKAMYRQALFHNLDLSGQPSGQVQKILDLYCNHEYEVPDFNQVYDIINVEHTWPQSKFSQRHNRAMQKTDLHHLFIVNAHVNNIRSSYDFGMVKTETKRLDCPGPKFGYDHNGVLVFEPPEWHKGAVARAMFYFALRYDMHLSAAQAAVLKQWNRQHPATADEISRNDDVQKLQGNRNPFVDDSTLIDRVF